MDTKSFKTVRQSQTTITELMIPSYANFGGKIHGGTLLSLMDKVAYACSSKHAGAYCVTASIDAVDFLHPIEVGDLVSLLASINYVGKSSMIVGIRVISENVKTQKIIHTNTSYFTMVAKDDNNNLSIVPALILETRDDIRRFIEAMMRKQLKLSYKQEIQKMKGQIDLEMAVKQLENERCRIAL
jgi:acyl-CoA hydrolase